MAKFKISFRYECEEEYNEEDIELIKENLDKVNLEENIKDWLDELLIDTDDADSRILDYRLELEDEDC